MYIQCQLVSINPNSLTLIEKNKGYYYHNENNELVRGDVVIKMEVLLLSEICSEFYSNLEEFFPPLNRKKTNVE